MQCRQGVLEEGGWHTLSSREGSLAPILLSPTTTTVRTPVSHHLHSVQRTPVSHHLHGVQSIPQDRASLPVCSVSSSQQLRCCPSRPHHRKWLMPQQSRRKSEGAPCTPKDLSRKSLLYPFLYRAAELSVQSSLLFR